MKIVSLPSNDVQNALTQIHDFFILTHHSCGFIYQDKTFHIECNTSINLNEILNEHNNIIDYAVSMIHSSCPFISFIFITKNNSWLHVRLTAQKDLYQRNICIYIEAGDITSQIPISLRELDVLTLIAAGLSNESIASSLCINIRTVAKHIENIFTKLGFRNRTQAASQAVQWGLLRLPTPGGHIHDSNLVTCLVERRAADTSSAPIHPICFPLRPIMVGMPLPIMGDNKADSLLMYNGARLAIDEINAQGGVLGRQLQLVTAECDLQSATSMHQAFEQLIDKEVDAISGGFSPVELSIYDVVTHYGAPYIHANSLNCVMESVRADNLTNIFQVCASDVLYGPTLAGFIDKLETTGQWKPHRRLLTVIRPKWEGLNINIEGMSQILEKRGWQLEIRRDPCIISKDWPAVIDLLHKLDPSVVFLASYIVDDGIGFQKAFASNPCESLVCMLYNPSVPQFREHLGENANGVLWATTSGLYDDLIGARFVQSYLEKFRSDPGHSQAGIAYDRVHILANAWRQVGNSRRFDKVSDVLRSIIYRGVNGTYFFGSRQEGLAFPNDTLDPSISKATLVFQIQDGQQQILSPDIYAKGNFQLPPWLLSSKN